MQRDTVGWPPTTRQWIAAAVGLAIGLAGAGDGSALSVAVRLPGYPVALMAIATFVGIVGDRRIGWFVAHEIAMAAIVVGWLLADRPRGRAVQRDLARLGCGVVRDRRAVGRYELSRSATATVRATILRQSSVASSQLRDVVHRVVGLGQDARQGRVDVEHAVCDDDLDVDSGIAASGWRAGSSRRG